MIYEKRGRKKREEREEREERERERFIFFNYLSNIFDVMIWILKIYIACNHQSYFWAIISKRNRRAGKYQEEREDTVRSFMRTALIRY